MVLRKVYFISLGALAFACALFAVPMVRAEALQLGQGAGRALLLALPTLLILFLAALPAMLRWQKKHLRLPLLGLGAMVGFAVLALPGFVADRTLGADLDRQGDVAAAPRSGTLPIGIEIQRNIGALAGPYDAAMHGPAPCTALCERLLRGGDAAWVRVVLRNDHVGGAASSTTVLLQAAKGAACRAVNGDFGRSDTCVLFAPDHGIAADLTLRFDEERLARDVLTSGLYQPVGRRRMIATWTHDGAIAFQQTRVFHRRPTIWLSLDVTRNINGDAPRGLGLLRSAAASDPLDPETALSALGLHLGPATARNQSAQDAAYVASMMATGLQEAPEFSRAMGRVVDGWHANLLAQPNLSAGDTAVFCATKNDRRLPGGYWKTAVTTTHDIACGIVQKNVDARDLPSEG